MPRVGSQQASPHDLPPRVAARWTPCPKKHYTLTICEKNVATAVRLGMTGFHFNLSRRTFVRISRLGPLGVEKIKPKAPPLKNIKDGAPAKPGIVTRY